MIVSPSLLAADRNALPSEAMKMKACGANYIHIDIMDGVFVPAKTWDSRVVAMLRKETSGLKLDTHLMIDRPGDHIDEYISAGAEILTVHYEGFEDIPSCIAALKHIRERGVVPGAAFKPETDPKTIFPLLPYCGQVIVMGVEPGSGGQPFQMNSLSSIEAVKTEILRQKYDCLVEIDGGINEKTAVFCRDSGADILVSGSYLYGHEDYKERLLGLLAL